MQENSELVFTSGGQQVLTCPTYHGGKNWEAGAYSPLTNTMYFPLRNTCGRMLASGDGGDTDISIELYSLVVRHQLTPGTDNLGLVRAISVETGETRWTHDQRAATMSLATTGGGLVFGGDVNGRFRALDQETGAVLWEINLGSAVSGFPISYAVDGRQYVAVSTGVSGRLAGVRPADAGVAPQHGQQPVRLCPAVTTGSVPVTPGMALQSPQIIEQ